MLDYVVIQIWTCTRTRTSESTAWNLNSWFGQRNWSLSYRRIVLRPVAPTRHTKAKGLWLAMNITEHDDGFVQCMTLSVNWALNLKLKGCPSTDGWNFFRKNHNGQWCENGTLLKRYEGWPSHPHVGRYSKKVYTDGMRTLSQTNKYILVPITTHSHSIVYIYILTKPSNSNHSFCGRRILRKCG